MTAEVVCSSCSKVFARSPGRGRPRLYCPTCSPSEKVANTRAWRERNRVPILAKRRAEYVPQPHPTRPCIECGRDFTMRTSQALYCSTACRFRPRDRVRGLSGPKRKRLVLEVAALYGTHCYICRSPIDLTRARPDRMMPSLDHVIPLARGGSRRVDNLRLTHLVCNETKHARHPTSAELTRAGFG